MKIVATKAEVRAWRAGSAGVSPAPAGSAGVSPALGSVGLVPTMGYLHEGHLALVRRARQECDRVAASIFVNPAQFDRRADLDAYPRDLERDAALLDGAGCDLLFAPAPAEIYPEGFATWIEPGPVAAANEGASRPGHFRGVATVVAKLFGIVRPDRAYFGRKDAQQLAVVESIVRDLDLPVEIVGVPTVREADGLAMSSRNVRLAAEDRAAAPVVYRALRTARDLFAAGERDAELLRAAMRRTLAAEPRVERVDYASVADAATFAEQAHADDRSLFSLAVWIGGVRLIDNLTPADEPAPRE